MRSKLVLFKKGKYMGNNKLSLLALTISAFIPICGHAEDTPTNTQTTQSIFNESAQAKADGFLEGSDLKMLLRNYYFNRDFRNSSHNEYGAKRKAQSYRREWAQGFLTTYKSGFTQGLVGFGVDAYGYYGVKLDSSKRRNGTGLLPINDHGKADDNYARYGGAVKARLSNTVLKYGRQRVDTPVFSTDDARLFPETAEGFLLTSEEIKNLTLNVGHFTTLEAMNQSYKDSRPTGWELSKIGSHKHGRGLKSADFIGGTYQFTPNLSASVYYSDLADIWKKKYLGLNYDLPINNDQAVGAAFNYYNTKSHGPVKQLTKAENDGDRLNSKVWSLQLYYALAGHKFSVAHQRVTGDGSGDPYGADGGGAIYLANSVQYSDFNSENERSWQVRYDLDMGKYGVPGLSFMTRYLRGDNISAYLRDGKKAGGKVTEREHDMEAKYVVQTGPAKNLSFRVRYAIYRSQGFANDINELRIITEYPWDILGTFKK